MPPAVDAVGLSYTYPSGRPGIGGVDFRVEPGERVVLLGPNGSGKSTLLRLLATERPPGGGSLRLMGEAAAKAGPALRRRIGYAPDRPVHLDALPGILDAEVFGRAAGLPAPEARARGRALLDRFGLGDDALAPAGEYSLGMRRKLLMAATLAPEPPLLLLDEPSLGLDPASVDTLLEILAERVKGGVAVVAALNDPVVAQRLADRVVFLERGRIVADGPPGRLLEEVGSGERVTVELADPAPAGLPDPPEGVELRRTGSTLEAHLPPGAAALPELLGSLLSAGVEIREIRVRKVDLRDVFRELTGRPLDAGPGEAAGAPGTPGAAGGPDIGPGPERRPRPETAP